MLTIWTMPSCCELAPSSDKMILFKIRVPKDAAYQMPMNNKTLAVMLVDGSVAMAVKLMLLEFEFTKDAKRAPCLLFKGGLKRPQLDVLWKRSRGAWASTQIFTTLRGAELLASRDDIFRHTTDFVEGKF